MEGSWQTPIVAVSLFVCMWCQFICFKVCVLRIVSLKCRCVFFRRELQQGFCFGGSAGGEGRVHGWICTPGVEGWIEECTGTHPWNTKDVLRLPPIGHKARIIALTHIPYLRLVVVTHNNICVHMFVDFEPYIGLGIHMLVVVCTKRYLTMKKITMHK